MRGYLKGRRTLGEGYLNKGRGGGDNLPVQTGGFELQTPSLHLDLLAPTNTNPA